MVVLVPIADGGGAFREPEYIYRKRLAEVCGRPMIQVVYENLKTLRPCRFVFIVRKDEVVKFHLDRILKLLDKNCEIYITEGDTEGAACTALYAIKELDGEEPVVIANGDQVIDANLGNVIASFMEKELDGGIITFDSVHPRWSYVEVDEEGLVCEAAEKRPISRHATAGIYYFKKGSDFVEGCMEMIKKDARTEGRFYICPVFNEMVLKQKRVGIREIPREAYHSMATPQGLKDYEELLKRRSEAV